MSLEQRFGGGEEIQAIHTELGAEHSRQTKQQVLDLDLECERKTDTRFQAWATQSDQPFSELEISKWAAGSVCVCVGKQFIWGNVLFEILIRHLSEYL